MSGGTWRDGRHRVEVGHLVMGLALLGLVGSWGLVQGDVVAGDDVRWLMPVPWIVAGVVGLLVTTLAPRRREPATPPAPRR